MESRNLKQVFITDDRAIEYLTGTRLNAMERVGGILIKADGSVHGIMNEVFSFEPMDGMTVHYYKDSDDPYEILAGLLDDGSIGFDKNWTADHVVAMLKKCPSLVPEIGSGAVDDARMIKGEDEKELLREAGRVNDMAIEFGINSISEGLAEKTLADSIEAFFEEHGGINVGQWQISCYGAGAAEPHHMPDDVSFVKEGDCVLIDIVAPINGYWCDMTRTVFWKEVSDENREVYEVVKAAQQAGIDAVRPGVRMCDIDEACRKVIRDAGYGEYFTHRTGHGVGMSVHEQPFVQEGNELVAEPGMCFSIEPGIYIKDQVGVRIEDLVIVTEDGCEVLTHYPKDLKIVGIE